MRLYQKLCARVNSRFEDFGVEKLEFTISHYAIVLTTTLLVVNGLSVNAMEDIAAQQESIKQEQIENLFEELNRLAAIKVNCEYLEAKGIINSKLMTTGINEPLQKNQYEQRAYELEQQLEELGVHKIDAGNKEDLNLLEELGNTSETSVCSSV